MPYFPDTNIPIGYTIIYDKWHEYSKNFYLETDKKIFWSNFVKQEYSMKINDIVQIIDVYLKKIEYLLKNNTKDFVNYDAFEHYIIKHTKEIELDAYKKISLLKQFWSKYNFSEGISTVVYSKFINFSDEFKKIYFKRDQDLKKRMTLHDCGLDNYLNYYDYARELYDNGIHSPDCKVIVDAHDCGLKHEDLVFVSNDVRMIEILSNMDTSHLEIIEFKACN